MTALNKQALREMAERAGSDSWGYDRDEFNDAITPEVVLALLDELEAKDKRIAELEKGHCGAPLLDREEAHVKTVSGLLAELGRWQQESSTWQSVAEKQLAIAIEAEKRIAELSASHSKLRETMAAIHNTIKQDGFATPLAVIMQNAKRAHEESVDAAGITVKGE